MNKSQIREKTNEILILLYQNRENDAINGIADLIQLYQQLLQNILNEAGAEQAAAFLNILKHLIENYQAQDMLGMADCIQGEIMPFLE